MNHDFLKRLGLEGTVSGVHGTDWIARPSGGELASFDPTSGETIGRVLQAGEADVERVLSEAHAAFLKWREVPAPVRGLAVRKLADALREKKDDLGRLVSLEMGKVISEGRGEIQEMIDICDFAVGLSRQLYGLTFPSERPNHRLQEQWHPLGIVGCITAFNFPAAVWSWNFALAAVCGDVTIWKPAERGVLVGVAVQKIAHEVFASVGHPGVSTLLVGPGRVVGEKLSKDARVPLLSFTGSTSVGKRVAANCSQHFGRTILELGGNNASIVLDDANQEMALRSALFGAVGTSGQRCTSLRRLVLDKGICGSFTERLVRAYKSVKIGDPLDEKTTMGPLVTKEAVDDVLRAIEIGKNQGGTLLTGGKRLDSWKSGCFMEPAIMKIGANAPIVKEETFGPLLYVIEANGLEDSLRILQDVPQGLSSSIFTRSQQAAEVFLSARGSDCGIANVNTGTSGAEIGGAFGGEKETGGGREAGSDSWKQYMRRVTSAINWSNDLPLAQGVTFTT